MRTILKDGDEVYFDGWTGVASNTTATVHTVRGYAEKYDEDVTEAEERARRLGHDLAFTVHTGNAIIYADRAFARQEAARRTARRAAATELRGGQEVEIDGDVYTVRIADGNERRPVNCDPIHFIPKQANLHVTGSMGQMEKGDPWLCV